MSQTGPLGKHPSHLGITTDRVPVSANSGVVFGPNGGLYVVGAGDLVVETWAGQNRTIPVPDFYDFTTAVRRLLPGTTATGVFLVTYD